MAQPRSLVSYGARDGMAMVLEDTLDPTTGLRMRSMLLNMGPSHPAMHGVIRIILQLEGEKVVDADVEIGYLHRAFEKEAETVRWHQVFPYTDRLNYVSPLINNVGYALAVEKLLGIDIPERAKYIRVILCELSRIFDHLTCIGPMAMEMGAMTVFLYCMKAREWVQEVIEDVTGARLTVSYCRIGGVKADLPEGFREKTLSAVSRVEEVVDEVDRLLTRNRIFYDRTKFVGVITKEEAISYGFTGPLLRATGVEYDVRKAHPYLVYDRVEFDIPSGANGDTYDRYLVRIEEIRQSARIIRQALDQMPPGSVHVKEVPEVVPGWLMVDTAKVGKTSRLPFLRVAADPTLEGSQKDFAPYVRSSERRVSLPPKEDVYGNIEGLMNHFMLIMEGNGIRPPVGETYMAVEGANGELGFYIVSDGTDRAYRVRVRPPCFYLMQALPRLIRGHMVADVIPIFGSINMIAGEQDR